LVAAVSGSLLLGAVFLIGRVALPASIPTGLILAIAVADLLGYRILDLGGQAFQAFERLGMTALINIVPNIARCAAAVIMAVLVPHASAFEWGLLYCASTIAAMLAVLAIVSVKLGRPRFAARAIPPQLKEGSYFSFGLSAQTIYNDVDKTMLARLATLDAAGIYGAAYRLIDVSFVPVKSLIYAAYPRMFHLGEKGLHASFAYAKKLMRVATAYGLGIGLALWFAAPLVGVILGNEYSRTVEALRWLAPLPLLKGIHYFFADSFAGAGYQGWRTVAQVLVAALNVGLNLWLIPVYSWRGAAWASIASDGALVISYAIVRSFLIHRDVHEQARVAESAFV
jgi:O-antigen/teichoic acid export membrane protein